MLHEPLNSFSQNKHSLISDYYICISFWTWEKWYRCLKALLQLLLRYAAITWKLPTNVLKRRVYCLSMASWSCLICTKGELTRSQHIKCGTISDKLLIERDGDSLKLWYNVSTTLLKISFLIHLLGFLFSSHIHPAISALLLWVKARWFCLGIWKQPIKISILKNMYFPERKLRAQKTSVILEDTAQVKTDFSNKTVSNSYCSSVVVANWLFPQELHSLKCHFSVAASVSHNAFNFLSFSSAKLSKLCGVIVWLKAKWVLMALLALFQNNLCVWVRGVKSLYLQSTLWSNCAFL